MSPLPHCPGSRCWNKVPLSWYQELLEVLKLKPEAGQAVAFHALPTARNSTFQISAYPVPGILPFKFLLSHFIHLSPNPLQQNVPRQWRFTSYDFDEISCDHVFCGDTSDHFWGVSANAHDQLWVSEMNAFSVFSPSAQNDFPFPLHRKASLHSFRSNLKTSLFPKL